MSTKGTVITIIGAAAAVAGRRAHLSWGATPEEVESRLPGDSLIDADLQVTRAISIDAPVWAVLPWIRQLGYGRGGFYTYDRLENLFGLDLHNADAVHGSWQVSKGDEVYLGKDVPLHVAILDHDDDGAAMVLLGVERPITGPMPFDFTWTFAMRPTDDGCRLIVRERYESNTWYARPLAEAAAAASWVMTQRMLRGIKSAAEHGVRASRPVR